MIRWREYRAAAESLIAIGPRTNSAGYAHARCPVCGNRKNKPTFWVSPSTGYYGCLRCDVRGRVSGEWSAIVPVPEAVVADSEETDEDETVDWLHGTSPVPILSWVLPEDLEFIDPIRFLAERNVSLDLAAKLGVCVATTGVHANRVLLPAIRSAGSPWFGYSARTIRKNYEGPKYLYPQGMERGSLMFNHDAIYEKTSKPLLVVEGVLDALVHWPNAVAVFGSASAEHIEALASASRPVVLAPDGDAWRKDGYAKCLHLLRKGQKSVGYLHLPPETDPDAYLPEELLEYAADAVGFFGIHGPLPQPQGQQHE